MTSTETVRTGSQAPERTRTALNWWRAALFGAVAATVLNLLVWGTAQVSGASLVLVEAGEPDYVVQAGSVASSSIVPMVLGIVLASVIARWWPGVIRLAQVLGALLAVGTLWSVFTYGADAVTITSLTLMHLISGAVVVLALEGLRRHVLARRRES
ncbi:hypothetical protein IDM40_18255 [Nocardiopsis sp. HNM0947]|uniref:Transmembrane protein n=1 Tax=Nocardiopsis coralli TaxID=2772213 RepID=A0ABR9P9V6_9ACTN|nr:DUF6069 family protein [Nocardiopsis coralli]MBE3000628.1 hypothetical protein [Nocardiopsis coralli]